MPVRIGTSSSNVSYKRRFELVAVLVKMSFTEYDIKVMLAELREACRRIRKLHMTWKTVATQRLVEMNHLRALETLQLGGEVMVSIGAMYIMGGSFQFDCLQRGKKLPRGCGQM